MTWSWVTGPVEPGRKCLGCRARLHGEHLVKWINGSDWHLHCLLDALAVKEADSDAREVGGLVRYF